MKSLDLDKPAVRRFLLRRLLLCREGGQPTPEEAVRHLQAVQMDPIDVCGRIHDLILRLRGAGYRRNDWLKLLYGPDRQAFEYYAPNLSIIPRESYRYFVRSMESHLDRRPLSSDHSKIAEWLLARIREEGPLRARAMGRNGDRTRSGWGVTRTVASHVLERLWLGGRLCIARREGFERWYDLPERHLPDHLLELHNGDGELPDAREEREFHVRSRLRSRALFRPRRKELDVLGADAFVEVRIRGVARPWYALHVDLDALEAARDSGGVDPRNAPATLLAPLDPLIYDRERTLDVFGFEYRWEVYTPSRKRRWGYYVLPLLLGDRLAGRADPFLNRASRLLEIRSVHYEDDPPPHHVVGALSRELEKLAAFLGASGVTQAADTPHFTT